MVSFASWKEKLLPAAGKKILIKSLVQAIPSYVMKCFHLPNSLCDELCVMVSQFYQGIQADEKYMHMQDCAFVQFGLIKLNKPKIEIHIKLKIELNRTIEN